MRYTKKRIIVYIFECETEQDQDMVREWVNSLRGVQVGSIDSYRIPFRLINDEAWHEIVVKIYTHKDEPLVATTLIL